MKPLRGSPYQWVYSLTVFLLVIGVVLRALLSYTEDARSLYLSLGLLAGWLVFFLTEPLISRRVRWYFPVYLIIQSTLIFMLLEFPEEADYFSVLYAILGMQTIQRFSVRLSIILIALFTPLIVIAVYVPKSLPEALALGFLYTAVNALLGAYGLATRRAQDARDHNQKMVLQLQEANQQLQSYSQQLEQLTVTRERSHLARELHDSVTQTIFSMTLTTQSATLLLERNPAQVKAQLDHLNLLAQNALAELQELITRLNPEIQNPQELATALRQHIAARHLPENLTLSLDVQAEGNLQGNEKQGLFRIVQEALNNIVKHAQASQATVRLHLVDPQWIEIEDNGLGFDPLHPSSSSGMGLAGMRERALEIGWTLLVTSSPGAGTLIRIEKTPSVKRQL